MALTPTSIESPGSTASASVASSAPIIRAPNGEVKWDNLPDELLVLVLAHLNGEELAKAKLVCRKWRVWISSTPVFRRTQLFAWAQKLVPRIERIEREKTLALIAESEKSPPRKIAQVEAGVNAAKKRMTWLSLPHPFLQVLPDLTQQLVDGAKREAEKGESLLSSRTDTRVRAFIELAQEQTSVNPELALRMILQAREAILHPNPNAAPLLDHDYKVTALVEVVKIQIGLDTEGVRTTLEMAKQEARLAERYLSARKLVEIVGIEVKMDREGAERTAPLIQDLFMRVRAILAIAEAYL